MPRALISVSNKEGIIEFAKELQSLDYEILSTGGTFQVLKENGIKVTKVSDYTKSPEIMDGRVKTLHPKIHGAILGNRDNETHQKEADENQIEWIDLVVVNLYPFEEVLAKEGSTEAEIIENIDIGGPTLLRASAKNFKHVTVITDPADYSKVLKELKANKETSLQTRKELACKCFQKTAQYDEAISSYMRSMCGLPELLDLHYEKVRSLRYGENPHQKAAFFRNPLNTDSNVTNAEPLGGKELSFNNIVDADAAIELVKEFDRPTVVFIKHNNPCGVASSDEIETAFELSHQVDELSAYGSVIAMNRECNEEIVDYIDKKKMFIEIIIAPSFNQKALDRLLKRTNLRTLKLGELKQDKSRRDIKKVAGGILIQSADTSTVDPSQLEVVTEIKPDPKEIQAMLFARKIVKHVKSNAVIFAKVDKNGNDIVTAIGAGQMSRVDAVFIARKKGGDKVNGSVMASDAFFPFADGVEEADKAGVTAILQPGGSIRDDEVIKRANELSLSMVFTGIRSFKH